MKVQNTLYQGFRAVKMYLVSLVPLDTDSTEDLIRFRILKQLVYQQRF